MCDRYKDILNNSVWIVPKSTLLAYIFSTDSSPKSVTDQTVWVIDSYEKGYVFGTTYVALDGKPIYTCKMIGSISVLGDVSLVFYSDTSTTYGQGKFLKIDGEYQFVMQTNTLNTLGVCHWSYMVSTNPKKKSYHHLPGVGMSVPEFIAQFN